MRRSAPRMPVPLMSTPIIHAPTMLAFFKSAPLRSARAAGFWFRQRFQPVVSILTRRSCCGSAMTTVSPASALPVRRLPPHVPVD